MEPVIEKDGVFLVLTQARGKVRIADEGGNHIRKPAAEGKNIRTNYIEWMITNSEIERLVKYFLGDKDKEELVKKLGAIEAFIKDSKYATREAIKIITEKLDKFEDFDIYKYTENFYSFEKEVSSKIKIRITFKMGDYTLAPHMFVLLPFGHSLLKIDNCDGDVKEGSVLGRKCRANWKPRKEDIMEIIMALSHASKGHRDDLINILRS